jgi:phosphoribosylamine-glycine ligase
MRRHHIPTAEYCTFTNAADAHAYIRAHTGGLVVKASGLCAGKGVYVCADAEAAKHAVDQLMTVCGVCTRADKTHRHTRSVPPAMRLLSKSY